MAKHYKIKPSSSAQKSNHPPKELPGMPERDALGKAAIAYLEAKNLAENAATTLDKAKAVLAKEFISANKTCLVIDKHRITYSMATKDRITVKNLISAL